MMNWDELYRGQPAESLPWHWEELDHDLEKALKELNIRSGEALDLGSGSGPQAIALAKRGFKVTGADLSPMAVELARKRAEVQKLEVHFVQDDILKSQLKGPFDFIFDRGCFHTLPPEGRQTYIETVHRLLMPSGYLFLKTFSHKEPLWDGGPTRFTPEEIETLFASSFRLISVHDTVFKGNRKPEPKALFSVLQRKDGSGRET